MKINVLTATAAAVAMLSTAAHAADTTYYEPAPQAQYDYQPETQSSDWSGGYAGVQLGGGKLNTTAGNDTALVGGAHAGYLMQRGAFVAGPEVSIDWTGMEVGATDVNAMAHGKVRAGVAIDNMIVTGSVGYGHAFAGNQGGGGIALGAGADMAITEKVIGGAEYQYTKIGGPSDARTHTLRSRLSYKFN